MRQVYYRILRYQYVNSGTECSVLISQPNYQNQSMRVPVLCLVCLFKYIAVHVYTYNTKCSVLISQPVLISRPQYQNQSMRVSPPSASCAHLNIYMYIYIYIQ